MLEVLKISGENHNPLCFQPLYWLSWRSLSINKAQKIAIGEKTHTFAIPVAGNARAQFSHRKWLKCIYLLLVGFFCCWLIIEFRKSSQKFRLTVLKYPSVQTWTNQGYFEVYVWPTMIKNTINDKKKRVIISSTLLLNSYIFIAQFPPSDEFAW